MKPARVGPDELVVTCRHFRFQRGSCSFSIELARGTRESKPLKYNVLVEMGIRHVYSEDIDRVELRPSHTVWIESAEVEQLARDFYLELARRHHPLSGVPAGIIVAGHIPTEGEYDDVCEWRFRLHQDDGSVAEQLGPSRWTREGVEEGR